MIDSVRTTVLSILNKNNYGYLPPVDFDKFAKLAQLEIFKSYFEDYNKVLYLENVKRSGSGIADMKDSILGGISLFRDTATLSQVGANQNVYYFPSISHNGNYIPYDNGKKIYKIESIQCYTGTGQSRVFRALAELIPFQMHATGYSNLMAPSDDFPVYFIANNKIAVVPATYNKVDSIDCTYIRTPADPKWTYTTVNGVAVYNPSESDHQDFEVGPEDEDKLVVKILKYAGISIREDQVAGFAKIEEQKEQNNN